MITRRWVAKVTSFILVGHGLGGKLGSARAAFALSDRLVGDFARIESESGGRLGVAVFDTLTGARCGRRADERFPMCSTFKLLAAAAILARVDKGEDRLDRRIRFQASDVVVNSPITRERTTGDGMSLEELCEAALILSDNTAGNLLLSSLGGPAGLTAYVRSIGDAVTRLDRIEPDLNEATPGDLRDTTTPTAMLSNIRTLLFGSALSAKSKGRIIGWLLHNKTGDTRLRAGFPSSWRIGDKTGSGENGATNDIGVVWPPNYAPILVSVYLTETAATREERNATLAAVARAIHSAWDR